MQCFLAGWLLSSLSKEGRDVMKIVDVEPGDESPTGFVVSFASGLKIAVRTAVLEAPNQNPVSEV